MGLLAQQMGVDKSTVADAWHSMEKQMIRHARAALQAGLLTEKYIEEVPPNLVIGLPARALLDTVERSPGTGIKLGTGLIITDAKRPRGEFADKVWSSLIDAREARNKLADP